MNFAESAKTNAEPTSSTLVPVVVSLLGQSGNGLTRREIIQGLSNAWSQAGGRSFEGGDFRNLKQALNLLQEQRIVENVMFGFYRLTHANDENQHLRPGHVASPSDELPSENHLEENGEMPGSSEQGDRINDEYVYAFYLPTYRAAAEAKGESHWPVRIGRTAVPAEQLETSYRIALPEAPEIVPLFRTDNAALLEIAMLGVLAFRGRKIDQSAESGWFYSNGDELVEMQQWITGALPLAGGTTEPLVQRPNSLASAFRDERTDLQSAPMTSPRFHLNRDEHVAGQRSSLRRRV